MNRGAFFASSAALAHAMGVTPQAIPGGSNLVERADEFDLAAFTRVVDRPARIRQLYEAVAFHPAVLNNIKNSFNGLQFGFRYPAAAISIVFAPHGASAAYCYSDEIWRRYRIGEYLKLTDSQGSPVTANTFVSQRARFDVDAAPDDEAGMYQDTSLETLQRRGLVVLTCHTAVQEHARALAARGFAPPGTSRRQIADDILTHLIPGAVVVPAMVAAIAVLQAAYRYTYLAPQL
ncbi:MAG: hypothetical protein JO311_05360 [Candidatus Eremiobacteraeota bacterium]|nr:hypothetical protein [Candidatus Eremiobacteraeota bacterium]